MTVGSILLGGALSDHQNGWRRELNQCGVTLPCNQISKPAYLEH